MENGLRVGVIQSNYIPWRGYFDFINSVDLFVFHDDLQYTKQDWRNRNKIKTSTGTIWLTVPVKKAPVWTLIDETEIAGEEWKAHHARMLHQFLGKAPFFSDAFGLWHSQVTQPTKTISELNIGLITEICRYLDIRTPLIHSRSLNLSGAKTQRLIHLMDAVKGDIYLSGPNAKGYLDVPLMNSHGIQVEWKEYNYKPYPQLHGQFEYFVSILDLIANTGPDAKNHIHSFTDQEMQDFAPHYNT